MQPAVIQIATSQRRKQANSGRPRRIGVLYVRAIRGGGVFTVLKVVDYFGALSSLKGVSGLSSASDGRKATSDSD